MIVREDERLDFSNVPESRGVPAMVYYFAVAGLICIFAIGGTSIVLSGWGHHWPANTTLRIDLGKHNQ